MVCSHCRIEVDRSAKFCPSCGGALSPTQPLPAITPPAELTEYDLVSAALADEYEVIEELGRGGMAIVYRARERLLERDVAVKVLPSSLAFDADFVERFEREARTAAKLEHPNIIPIYRVGRSGKVIYFVMKYLRGNSLADLVERRGALSPGELRGVLSATAAALGYAHQNGIVHRDIKPDNIMFDESGRAVVTDFGIAKAASGNKLTGTGMSIGTPLYMSPEQARAQALDGRSDIYSLGIVMYQCLTGRVPFDGEDAFAIGLKHIMEKVPTPTFDSNEQRALYEVVERMVAKQPDARFQTAEELLDYLENGGEKREVWVAAPTMVMPPQPADVVGGVARAEPVAEARKPLDNAVLRQRRRQRDKKGRRALVAWLAASLLVIAGAGTYWYVGSGAALPRSLVKQIQPGVAFANDAHVESAGATTLPISVPAETLLVDSVFDPLDSAIGNVDSLTPMDSLRPLEDSVPKGALDSVIENNAEPLTEGAADSVAPTVAALGVLVLAGLPRTAQLSIDGESKRGLRHEVESGEHLIEVTASGYESFTTTVSVEGSDTVPVRVSMVRIRTRRVDVCAQTPPPAEYFSVGTCYDSRPSPLSPPLVRVTNSSSVPLDPVPLLVKVATDGTAAQILRGRRQTAAPRLILSAIQFVRDSLRFQPAVKDGTPIEAWARLTVQFRPVP